MKRKPTGPLYKDVADDCPFCGLLYCEHCGRCHTPGCKKCGIYCQTVLDALMSREQVPEDVPPPVAQRRHWWQRR